MNTLKKLVILLTAAALLLGSSVALAADGEWTCPACGAANTTNFCEKCGSRKPEELLCPGCGKAYPIDTDAIYCGDCGTRLREDAVPAFRYEGPGFDTPEEAVSFYLEGLKNADVDQMLLAFAWETQEAHYSMEANLNRMGAYTPAARPRMPMLSGLRSANINSMRAAQIDYIYRSFEAYILGEDYPAGKVVSLKTEEETAAFLGKYDNGRIEKLSGMTNIRFLSPDEITGNRFSTEAFQNNLLRQLEIYGGDEITNVAAIADVGEETLFVAPTAVRYGDKWYLVSVTSITNSLLGIAVDYHAFVCADMDALF